MKLNAILVISSSSATMKTIQKPFNCIVIISKKCFCCCCFFVYFSMSRAAVPEKQSESKIVSEDTETKSADLIKQNSHNIIVILYLTQ